MKITLISPYPDITAFGLRTISAHLKAHGHTTQLIFLPDPYGDNLVFGVKRYDDHVLDSLIPLCADSGLIGITLMTNFYEGAVQITKKLKSALKAPVIWGGIHPTIRPEESLEHADIVCIGDGEEAILELVQKLEKGEAYTKVKNLCVMEKGRFVKNPPRNLPHDLDVYPRPDYSYDDTHIMYEGRIQPLTYELTKTYLENGTVSQYIKKTGYQTMTGRGCPHKCTYCINDTLKTMYNNDNYLRWRSTAHVIDELQWVKKNMPYIGFIWISDDAFFARNKKSLEEFCAEYKAKINLPFTCLASPMTISEEKMELLVDAGLMYLQMGVESGSAKVQELFNRKQMNNEKLRKAFNIINRYKNKMYPPSYDFILDVPYETDADKIDSLKLIAEIPKPFQLQPFSLILYPGTKLYEMAKADGMIQDEKKQIYEKSYTMRAPSYLNLLITLSKNGKFPSPVLKLLVSAPVVDILNSKPMRPVFKSLFIGLKATYRMAKRLTGRGRA
ncbi:MAG: B12-binding domain-containing radical SAM protein [Deltaproteobacteria bacterium]|nr:B12-binding domain-containing radical SAM protein [Deltaproteobacteria bacterium]